MNDILDANTLSTGLLTICHFANGVWYGLNLIGGQSPGQFPSLLF